MKSLPFHFSTTHGLVYGKCTGRYASACDTDALRELVARLDKREPDADKARAIVAAAARDAAVAELARREQV